MYISALFADYNKSENVAASVLGVSLITKKYVIQEKPLTILSFRAILEVLCQK